MSFEEKTNQKNENTIKNIISLGSSLNIELIISLEEKQYESIGINYKEISNLEDLKKLYPHPSPLSSLKMQKLTSLIELHSNNFLFNSILFINQSSKKKYSIKYLIPFSPKFPKEFNFVYDIIKSITEINNIYIEDSNLLDIKPNIFFTLKLTDKDIIIEQKSFLITDENHYNNKIINENKKNGNKEINEYNGDLFEGLNFEYNCDFFYSTINELFNCKKNSENEINNFINKLSIKYPKARICINYDENYLIGNKNFINNILINTDIFIFEKKDVLNFYNNLFSSDNDNVDNKINKINNSSTINSKSIINFFIDKIKNKKLNQKIKLGIFINNMKEIFLLQKDPKSQLIIFQLNQELNLIPNTNINEDDKNKYNEIIKTNYNALKSVYIGAFLNRLIKQESFEVCLKVALRCSIKYLDILKFGLDVPTIQNYYVIKNSKKHKKKINKLEIKNKILENKFILDCTNVNNKRDFYNSLYDENCINFFNSRENRKYLLKQGFINKKGIILDDPEKYKEKYGTIYKKDKKFINGNKYHQILNNIKEAKENNDNKKEKINNKISSSINKHYSYRNFDSFYHGNNTKVFYLPKLKNKYMDKSPNNIKNFERLGRENSKDVSNIKFINFRKKNLSEMNYDSQNFNSLKTKLNI